MTAMHTTTLRTAAAVLALAVLTLGAAGCGKSEPPKPPPVAAPAPAPAAPVAVSVKSIDLGNAIGADKKVVQATNTFGTKDTIYASVATEGGTGAKVALTALWTFGDGQKVMESVQELTPTGPAVTEFRIEKPSGWPVGKYMVTLTLDGKPAGSKAFEVK